MDMLVDDGLDPITSSTAHAHASTSNLASLATSKRGLAHAHSTGASRSKRQKVTTHDIAVNYGENSDDDGPFSDPNFSEESDVDHSLDSPYVDASVIDPSLKPVGSASTSAVAEGKKAAKKVPRARSTPLATAQFDLTPSIGYTHISQALAVSPNVVNASQQTGNLVRKLAAVEELPGTTEDRLMAFMSEVKNQMFLMSERLDAVETNKHANVSAIDNLRSSFHALETRLGGTPPSPPPPHNHLHLPSPLHATSASMNPVSDAANAQQALAMDSVIRRQLSDSWQNDTNQGPADFLANPAFIQSIVSATAAATAAATSGHGSHVDGDGGDEDVNVVDALSSLAPSPNFPQVLHPPKPLPPVAAPAKKAKKPTAAQRKREASASASGETKPKARPRKPELSRAVRATMFKLLGVSLAGKYHGYTSQPDLPDFSPVVAFDPVTGGRLWRWEWDKTIRQSQYNLAFSNAIQNQVVLDRDTNGQYRDVPAGDWASLEDAVDSAYTNLRRERDAQVDPVKKQKKDEHRKRGKKRGLKEEKCKRRQKAFHEGGVSTLADGEKTEPAVSWINMITSFEEGENLDGALDLKYMSSEDEIDYHDPAYSACPEIGSSATTPVQGDKTFVVSRPAWRSEKLARAFGELDGLKPPERAYRRLLGPTRADGPPEGTPDWMIRTDWDQGQDQDQAEDEVLNFNQAVLDKLDKEKDAEAEVDVDLTV